MINYRGAFLRCIGGNADELGVLQGDAIRNIKSVSTTSNAIMSVSESLAVRSNPPLYTRDSYGYGVTYSISPNIWSKGLLFDASLVVPTADENRPVNYSVNICIIYE